MSQVRLKKLREEIEKLEDAVYENSILHYSLMFDIHKKEDSEEEQPTKKEYENVKKVINKLNSDIDLIKTKTQEILKIKRDAENTKNKKVFYEKLIQAVPEQKIVSKTISIKVPKQEENPQLNKALKRLEALRKKPKSILIKTLIKEQEFIIRKLREVARIANLRKKLK